MNTEEKIRLRPGPDALDEVKELFNEYTDMLGVNLTFQNYEAELAALPGKYSLPQGRLYLLDYDHELAGCGALRPMDDHACEMKRLYVRPRYRALGLGKFLAQVLIDDARKQGYRRMYLDTFLWLESAVKMYQKMGFLEVQPYYDNPFDDVVYLCLNLE